MRPPLNRESEIARLRERLERFGFPRLRMLLIVSLTGACGFVTSAVLLHAGMLSMPVRYAIALLIAYAVFLGLLRLWMRDPHLTNPDLPDVPGSSSLSSSTSSVPSGRTGSAGHDSTSSGSGSWLEGLDAADEFTIPLMLVIATVTVLFASLWIVVSAPTLFAELFLDGVLSASLYHRLRKLETRHWLDTALRRTIVPFGATALAVVLFAVVAQHLFPAAHSLAGVLHPHRTLPAIDSVP